MCSPRAHFGLVFDGISQAFSFKVLFGLTYCLGLPCEGLNVETFQPRVTLHEAKFIFQISCQNSYLSMGWGSMMWYAPNSSFLNTLVMHLQKLKKILMMKEVSLALFNVG